MERISKIKNIFKSWKIDVSWFFGRSFYLDLLVIVFNYWGESVQDLWSPLKDLNRKYLLKNKHLMRFISYTRLQWKE